MIVAFDKNNVTCSMLLLNMPYSWQLLSHVWWVHATTSMTYKSNPIPSASDQSCQPHCNFSGTSLILHSSQSPMSSSAVPCPYCNLVHLNSPMAVHYLWRCWILLLIGMAHGKECNPVVGQWYYVLYKGIFGAPNKGQMLFVWWGQTVESGLRHWAQHLIRIWGGRATTSSPNHYRDVGLHSYIGVWYWTDQTRQNKW